LAQAKPGTTGTLPPQTATLVAHIDPLLLPAESSTPSSTSSSSLARATTTSSTTPQLVPGLLPKVKKLIFKLFPAVLTSTKPASTPKPAAAAVPKVTPAVVLPSDLTAA